MLEVKKKRKNSFTIWLNYNKALDSVLHEWIIYDLQHSKHLKQLNHPIIQWCITLHLRSKNETIISDSMKMLKNIFQGDSLSVLLFILTVNTLSFTLRNIKRYPYGNGRTNDITRNLLVDDLKSCFSNIHIKNN